MQREMCESHVLTLRGQQPLPLGHTDGLGLPARGLSCT